MAHSLCQIWPNLPQINAKAAWETLERFLKGEHVQRHRQGLWNGIWTDMFIDTMFMHYGLGPGGLIGITLNQKAIHRWAISLYISSRLMKDMADLKDSSSVNITSTKRNWHHRSNMPTKRMSSVSQQHSLQLAMVRNVKLVKP